VLKRVLKGWVAGMAAVLVLLVILAGLVLFVPWFFHAALRTAGPMLPVRVEVGTYHHVPGKLSLGDVRVSSDRGPIGQVRSLEVRYAFLRLFLGRIDVRSLQADGLRFWLDRFPDGRLSLSGLREARPKQEEGEPFDLDRPPLWLALPIRIRRMEVTDGQGFYRDASAGFEVAWEGLALAGHAGTRPLEAELRLEGAAVRVRKQGAAEALGVSLSGRAELRDRSARLTGLRLEGAPGELSMQGSYDLESAALTLSTDLRRIALDRILSAWGVPGVEVEGVGGRIEGGWSPEQGVAVQATLTGDAFGHAVRADLRGGVKQGVVRLDSLVLQEPEASLTGKGTLDTATGRVSGNVRLDAPRLDKTLATYGWEGNLLEDLRVDAEIGGTLSDPRVRATLLLGRWSSGQGPLLGGISAEGGYAPGGEIRLSGSASSGILLPETEDRKLSFSLGFHRGRGEVSLSAGPSLALDGSFHLEHHQVELSFTARRARLTTLARIWLPELYAASLSARGSFRGDVRDRATWVGDARIQGLHVSLPGLTLETDRQADLALGNGVIDLGVSARVNGEPLSVQGTVPLVAGQDMDVRARATVALSPFQGLAARFAPQLRACKGTLTVDAEVDGPARSPRVRASVRLTEGSVRIASGGSRPGPGGSDFQHLSGGTEPDSRDIFRGEVRLSADLDGPLRAPGGSLSVAVSDALVYGIPVEEAEVDAAGDGSVWTTDHARAKTPYGTLSLGEAVWDLESGRISGKLRSSELEIGPLAAPRGIPIEGAGRIEGAFQGRVADPVVNLHGSFRGLSLAGRPYGDADLRAEIQRTGLNASLEIEAGRMDLSVRLDDTLWIDARASLADLPLGPVLAAAKVSGWTGALSLEASLEGPAREPGRWKGAGELARLELESAGLPIRLEAPVRLSLASGQLSLSEAALVCQGSRFTLQGRLGRESDLSVNGTLVLTPFGRLLSWVNLKEGAARVDMSVTGAISDPKLRGSMRVEAKDISFPGRPFPVGQLTADLTATETGVELASLTARVGDGTVEARGRVAWGPFSVEGATLELKSVPVTVSDTLDGVLQGKLSFDGNQSGSFLQGSIRIVQARYEQDFDLLGTVLRPRRPPTLAVRSPPEFLSNMRLDVKVRSGPDLFVRNNIAKMILSMDLNIRGTAADPAPAGRVKVLDGRVYFQNQDFIITRGNLDFLGEPGALPVLHLESRAEVDGRTRTYNIFLTMDGPLDRIELTMSSIPALSQEDILFVLFTGMTQDEYFARPSDMKGTASGLAAAGISGLFGKDVKTWTGLDTFEMSGYEAEGAGVKATLGKRFGERMEVRGAMSVGEELNRGEAQVEYQLAEGIYLVGTQRTDGSFGLDIRFRFVGR